MNPIERHFYAVFALQHDPLWRRLVDRMNRVDDELTRARSEALRLGLTEHRVIRINALQSRCDRFACLVAERTNWMKARISAPAIGNC